jgi:hypothetical protein
MSTTTAYTVLVVCCLLGMPALAAERTTPFKCEGQFGRNASHAKLAATFGADNAVSNEDAESDSEVTILFPNNAARRLKIEWNDQKSRRGLRHVTITGLSWSVAGVVIGMPLVELERLNGGPFKLNYFEGDYGGAITDWLGGRFNAPLSGGCVLGVFVGIDERHPDAPTQALEKEVMPDRSLLSSGAGLRATKPVVSKMIVSFPK